MPETLSLFNDPSANEEASRPPFPIPVTATLIALNVLVYLAMVVKGVSPLSPTAQQVLPWGANFGPLTFAGQWWRIVTCQLRSSAVLNSERVNRMAVSPRSGPAYRLERGVLRVLRK